MNKITYLFLVLLIFISACEKPEVNTNKNEKTFESYDRNKLVKNIGENVILPSYNELQKASIRLQEACLVFNTSPNQTNLDSLQSKWRKMASAWKKCEVYNFGPSAEISYSYYSSIDYNPINTTTIEDNLFTISTIDSAFVANKGSTVKGLSSMEYLLFDNANGDEIILNKFVGIDFLTKKRKEYLVALSINIKGKCQSLYNSWLASQGNYITTFVANNGNGLSSSIGNLVNQLAYLLESMKNNKINIPLGSGNNGVPKPNLVESALSESSINHLNDNLTSIENTYLGNGIDQSDSTGFDDLLNYLNVKSNDTLLSKKIQFQFQRVHTSINAINSPMQNTVSSNPQSLITASEEIRKLLVLFKIDIATALGVTITFNLNDGD